MSASKTLTIAERVVIGVAVAPRIQSVIRIIFRKAQLPTLTLNMRIQEKDQVQIGTISTTRRTSSATVMTWETSILPGIEITTMSENIKVQRMPLTRKSMNLWRSVHQAGANSSHIVIRRRRLREQALLLWAVWLLNCTQKIEGV